MTLYFYMRNSILISTFKIFICCRMPNFMVVFFMAGEDMKVTIPYASWGYDTVEFHNNW